MVPDTGMFWEGMLSQIKLNLYYSRAIAPKPVTSSGVISRLSAWAAQHPKNVAAVASHWRPCVWFHRTGIEPLTSHTGSDVLELTGMIFLSADLVQCHAENCECIKPKRFISKSSQKVWNTLQEHLRIGVGLTKSCWFIRHKPRLAVVGYAL